MESCSEDKSEVCSLSVLESVYIKIVEASPDANIVCDDHRNIVIFNAQAELLFGYSRQDVLGKTVDVLLQDEFQTGHAERFQWWIDEPRIMEISSIHARHRSGRLIPIQVKIAPIVVPSAGVYALAIVRRRRVGSVDPPWRQRIKVVGETQGGVSP